MLLGMVNILKMTLTSKLSNVVSLGFLIIKFEM
jgi:hypothetical protein